MLAREIIEQAAQILEDGGWCKQSYHPKTGEHCARGALAAAAIVALLNGCPIALINATVILAEDAIKRQIPDNYTIEAYNDRADTTYEDIQLMLKRAAASL